MSVFDLSLLPGNLVYDSTDSLGNSMLMLDSSVLYGLKKCTLSSYLRSYSSKIPMFRGNGTIF